jgi:hypothetical protein
VTTKEQLHQLVDQLTEHLAGAERALSDPFLLSLLDTPEGEEPLTAAEIAGLLEAHEDIEAGRVRRFAKATDLIADLHSAVADESR